MRFRNGMRGGGGWEMKQPNCFIFSKSERGFEQKCDRSVKRLALDWSWITRWWIRGVQYETYTYAEQKRERKRRQEREREEKGARSRDSLLLRPGKKKKRKKKTFFFKQKKKKKKLRCAPVISPSPLSLALSSSYRKRRREREREKSGWMCILFPIHTQRRLIRCGSLFLQTKGAHTKRFQTSRLLYRPRIDPPFFFPCSSYASSLVLFHWAVCLI